MCAEVPQVNHGGLGDHDGGHPRSARGKVLSDTFTTVHVKELGQGVGVLGPQGFSAVQPQTQAVVVEESLASLQRSFLWGPASILRLATDASAWGWGAYLVGALAQGRWVSPGGRQILQLEGVGCRGTSFVDVWPSGVREPCSVSV